MNLIEKARNYFYKAFPGRRLTANTIAANTEQEAYAAHQPNPPARITETPDLLTPMATSYAGLWTLARLVARSAKRLATLRSALSGAQLAYVKAVVAGRLFLADKRLPAMLTRYNEVVTAEYSREASLRTFRLQKWVLVLVLVAVAVTDFAFFLQLMLDVQQVSFSDPADYLPKLAQAIGFASITPLAVVIVGEYGGRRVARLRTELRDRADADEKGTTEPRKGFASLWGAPLIWLGALALLVIVFAIFASHRFESLASGPGAASAEPWMLAMLVALLPIVAFAASIARNDLAAADRQRVIADWTAARATMVANQEAQRAALLAWRAAWDALYDVVGGIVAEAQLSFQTWESLVLRGLAKGNERGVTAYALDSVAVRPEAGSGPGVSLKAVLETVAATAEFSVRVPVRQVATKFTTAEWVIDELEITLQSLVRFLPNPDAASVTADIDRELAFARPIESALALAEQPPAPQPTGDTAEFERLVGSLESES